MVEWLAGNRIIGTTAERPLASLQSPSVGGWVELGRTTLGSNNANINISSIPDKRYYMLLSGIDLGGASTGGGMRLGSGSADTGSNYAFRASGDGGADGAYTNRVDAHWVGGYADLPEFYVTYIANKSDKEKLVMSNRVYGATGAGTAPKRNEFAGKWTNTSNPLDYINYYQGGSDTYDSGSELVLLGWDAADTHTTNFWEELASVDLSGGAADTLSSGTFTAKKYLWIQAYTTATGGTTNPYFRVGNTTLDTGSNYAIRYSTNGAADSTLTSQSNIPLDGVTLATGESSFSNFFIINNASNEKLIIHHSVESEAAGAGAAPSRIELASKWTNTSNQIDIVGLNNVSGTGDFGTETTLKVWGSD